MASSKEVDLASPANKFSNTKAPVVSQISMIEVTAEQSSVSTPREDYTPYMSCMQSPEKIQTNSNGASPGKERNSSLRNREADPGGAKRMKVISFGASRCTGSPVTEGVMGGTLSSHQGIMTFGNFAALL